MSGGHPPALTFGAALPIHEVCRVAGFRTLRQGSRVTYDLVQGPKGDSAQNIRPLTPPPGADGAAAEAGPHPA